MRRKNCLISSLVLYTWRRRGVLVSVVRPYVSPVSTWMGDRLRAVIPSRYVTNQVGQLTLTSPGVAKSSTSLAEVKPGGR